MPLGLFVGPGFAIQSGCWGGSANRSAVLVFLFDGRRSGHIQTLIPVVLLLIVGFFLGVAGLVADQISVNRELAEKLNWRVQKIEGRIDR